MNYRPEIDGLRAIAVIPVILFHAGFGTFSGGYVGVDIFFVISGYLITTILINDLEASRFSVARFYERRARRILPALLFVMLACLPLAWAFMLPSQLEEFGRNIMAVALFVSNIALWLNTDYFASATELNPLLHTWSLAVEEQFYIFFPPLLWALWKVGRKWPFAGVMVLSMASFGLAEWGCRNAPDANFYLLPFRAWELGAGSICAFVLKRQSVEPNDLLSLGGLFLIAYSVVCYSSETPFPSAWALAPVGGTMLIILFSTSSSLIARALSLKPLVAIGLISYSAYLWHQPLFAFARMARIDEPSRTIMLLLAVFSLFLAYMTWRFVENPFRSHNRQKPRLLHTRAAVFSASAGMLASFIAIGAIAYTTDGLPQRSTRSGVSYQDLDLGRRLSPNYGMSSACRSLKSAKECQSGPDPHILLWGDSFAMHLGQALLHSPGSPPFVQMTRSACGPFMGISIVGEGRFDAKFAERCIEFNDRVVKYIRRHDIDLVIASSAMRPAVRQLYTRDGSVLPRGSTDAVLSSMRATAELVNSAGSRIVWVSPPPSTGEDLSKCATQAIMRGALRDGDCRISVEGHLRENASSISLLQAVQDTMPVVFLDEFLCDKHYCKTIIDGNIMYRDDGHLTIEGSRLLGEKYNLMGRARKAAANYHGGERLAHPSKYNRHQTLRSALPANIRLANAFEPVRSRSFADKDGATRRGVSFRTTGMDARTAFSKVEASITAAGYRQRGKIRAKGEERISGFFRKAGHPTLYVRSMRKRASDPTTPNVGIESTIWISWQVPNRALKTDN